MMDVSKMGLSALVISTVALAGLGMRPGLASCPDHPLPHTAATLSDATPSPLEANAASFVSALFSGKVDQAWTYLAPVAQAENTPAILQRKAEQFQKSTGKFEAQISSRVQGPVVVLKLKFSKVTDDFIVIFDDAGKIVGVDFPASEDDISAQPPA